jgi:hypothetical protein
MAGLKNLLKNFFAKDAVAGQSTGFDLSKSGKVGIIEGAMGIAQGLIGRQKRKQAQIDANRNYETRMEDYQALDTSNLAAGFENTFSENVYEDITVNTQQADFMAQQQAQNQANIMQGLQGAAGGSGIAGLAQALANQSTMANQKASALIGAQEQKNQLLVGKGELAMQKGEMIAQQTRLKGETAARQLESDKTATLLGMSQMEKAAADKAMADANSALYGGIGKIAGGIISGKL